MKQAKALLGDVFFTHRFFICFAMAWGSLVLGFFFVGWLPFALILWLSLVLTTCYDIFLLFATKGSLASTRSLPDRLSNGDENEVRLSFKSTYRFPVFLHVLEEFPAPFQLRDFSLKLTLKPALAQDTHYTLRPTRRGVYAFGQTVVFGHTKWQLVARRFRLNAAKEVAVYPSFLQMRKYELYAISNRLLEAGGKRIRKIGRATNFEQIRTYVAGDELRTINWAATARQADLMVNQYEEERAQQVFSILDLGRAMETPFDGMSLLDYAINAALVVANVAIHKQDKAGLVTFSDQKIQILPPERNRMQMHRLLEHLYKLETNFLEANFERMYAEVKRKIPQRSLLFFYTNFASVPAMRRRLPLLRKLAGKHLLVIIFFENTTLKSIMEAPVNGLEDTYTKVMAEKMRYEKQEIVRELGQYGIHTLLTTPQNLTLNTLNKYLELKANGWL